MHPRSPGPRRPLARIEVEDEHVGTLEVVDARIPWVQLDGADLGVKYEEAAEILQVPVGTVLSRARSALRAGLDPAVVEGVEEEREPVAA